MKKVDFKVVVGIILILVGIGIAIYSDITKPDESFMVSCSKEEYEEFYG